MSDAAACPSRHLRHRAAPPSRSQVAQAYRELLRREPDAGGMQGYMQLCAQRGIAPVRQSIQGSEEYRRLTSFFLFRGA